MTAKDYAREFARMGGKAGTGKSKVRGGSDYYARIAKARWAKKKQTQNGAIAGVPRKVMK